MKEYPETLAAVESAERSKWPIVEALVAEIETTASGMKRAKAGEFSRAAKYLEKRGYPSYSDRRLQGFYEVGVWLEPRQARFQQYPFERVIEAKKAARSDHEKALEILGTATSKRDIRPDKPSVQAVQKAIAEDPEFADEVMEDPIARMRVRAAAERQTQARLGQAESERRANAKGSTQDEVDGRHLISLGAQLDRIIAAARNAAAGWKRVEPLLSEEGRDLAVDSIAETQGRVDTILEAMRGEDLDSALTKILAGEEEAVG